MRLTVRRNSDGSMQLLGDDGSLVDGVEIISMHSDNLAEGGLRHRVTVTLNAQEVGVIEGVHPLADPPRPSLQPVPDEAEARPGYDPGKGQ